MLFGGDNADSYYDEGVTASMKGDLETAIGHFENAIKRDQTMGAAYHQLGRCYLRLGQAERAASILAEVVRKRPKQVPPRLDLAYALLDTDKIEAARKLFIDVLEAKPANARAQLGLAQCAFNEKNWQAAMALAQDAITAGGDLFPAYYLLGRAAKHAQADAAAMEAFEQADKKLEQTVETGPNDPEGYFLRGEVLAAMGRKRDADEQYLMAEERAKPGRHYAAFGIHFTLLDVLDKRAGVLQDLGDAGAARAVAAQLLELDPDHERARKIMDA